MFLCKSVVATSCVIANHDLKPPKPQTSQTSHISTLTLILKMPRPPNLELDNLSTSSSSPLTSPDLPLSSSPQPQPRWLTPRQSRLTPYIARLKTLLRPRLTWRYILCTVCAVYVLYCFIVASPLFASRLPAYSGPHTVGAVDLEIPLPKPLKISDTIVKKTGELAFEVETVLFTVYYPAAHNARSKLPQHLWVPRPLSITAEGYARIARVDNFIVRPIFTFALWLLVGSIRIPAQVDVPILGSDGDEKAQRFPVMVFSHGMASSRTDYTYYLGELASRGYVVAAIEHRDGSSPGSLVKINGKKDRKVVLLREKDVESDPPMTTPQIKKEQLAFRDAEIFATIKVLQDIDAGDGASIFSQTSRSEGTTLSAWTNRLDLSHLIIGGHSYGATGALQALKSASRDSKSNPAAAGIILDPGKESGPLNADIQVPILVVHSNSWSKSHSIFFGRPHFDTVRDLVRDTLNRTGASWFLTSLGTSHPSVTDAPLIEPLLLSWTTGATVDVKYGLREYVRVSLDFFDFVNGGEKKGVLGEPVTHEEYGKWVSEERKKEFPKEMAKFWEVHVSPVKKKA